MNENSNSLGHIDGIGESGYITLDKYGDRLSIEILENPFVSGMLPERGDVVVMAITDLHSLLSRAKATRNERAKCENYEANARLIASAPDMAAEIQALREEVAYLRRALNDTIDYA